MSWSGLLATPPPMTISDGLKKFTMPASIEPTDRPAAWSCATATGSPTTRPGRLLRRQAAVQVEGRRQPGAPAVEAAASPARPSAAPPASASRQPTLPHRHRTVGSSVTWMWPTSPALPWAPRCRRPSEMMPGPDPGPDLDDDHVVVARRDAGSPLAEREQVDVVVDPDRAPGSAASNRSRIG